MFLGRAFGLGQVSPTRWQDQVASKVSPDASKPDWAGVGAGAAAVASAADAAEATPINKRAMAVVAAAKAAREAPDDPGKAASVADAVRALVAAAKREDQSSVEDRIRAEELIDRRMARFEQTLRDWKAEHSGFRALIARVTGGPDATPLVTEAAAIQAAVETTPLTAEGRQRLVERHAGFAKEIAAVGADWKPLLIGGIGLLAWKGLSSGAVAAAKAGAGYAATKAQERMAKGQTVRRTEPKAKKSKKSKKKR